MEKNHLGFLSEEKEKEKPEKEKKKIIGNKYT